MAKPGRCVQYEVRDTRVRDCRHLYRCKHTRQMQIAGKSLGCETVSPQQGERIYGVSVLLVITPAVTVAGEKPVAALSLSSTTTYGL